MRSDSGGRTRASGFNPPLSAIKARQMGELQRGDDRWDVLLETVADPSVGAVRGRMHFIGGTEHRLSGWIFLEWSEKEVESRFEEMFGGSRPGSSAQELWNLLDAL